MRDSLRGSSLLMKFIDPLAPTKSDQYPFTSTPRGYTFTLLAGLTITLVSVFVGMNELFIEQFYFSYLIGWVFCLSISLGCLFIVLIKHLVRAEWIVSLRRIPEAASVSFPLLAILSIPVIISLFDPHGPYHHWTTEGIADPTSSHYDEIVAGKVAYLNIPFFLARIAFYFIAWTFVSSRLWRLSVLQDVTGDPHISVRLRHLSAWGLPLCAITTAFAGFDLLMTLDPHWFSTIFGVYFFAGAFLSAFCFTALTVAWLQRAGMLRGVVTAEHYHDLGKLMFGFVVFWAYIAFSQYMLIWYGGIPEETAWFKYRLQNGWETHSGILLFGHFIVPFIILLPRAIKRYATPLAIIAVWLLMMQWFDLHWQSMPVLHKEQAQFHWLDLSCWAGLFSLFVAAFLWRFSRHAIVCEGDPQLGKSLRFENV
ncbi:MAG: hypothetical protein OXE92_02080 [Bacteroidetes bacterium]|nr:hypothetical protein [Bacteroidota bacterium]MCY4204496.1 hypothetical protein [Bacteroidota bacterium]